jgi:hypothetical protein
MVLVPNPNLETFPICCKKYSLIFYLRQTNRYVPRKLPDVHGMAWHGMAWHGMAANNKVRRKTTKFDTRRPGEHALTTSAFGPYADVRNNPGAP